MIRLLLIALLFGTALLPLEHARAQTAATPAARAAAPSVVPGLTAAQAQQALDVLKDPARRAQFIGVLETLAKTAPTLTAPTPAAADPPAATLPLAPDSLGAQLLVDGSRRLATLTDDIVAALRALTDFPLLWRFVVQMATDPWSRTTMYETGWRLLLVCAGGLAAQWAAIRLLARPSTALIERATITEAARRESRGLRGLVAAEAGATEAEPRRRLTILQFLRRLPAAIGRLLLDLLPILAFLAASQGLLAAGLGRDPIARLVILGMITAYALCRVATTLQRAAIGPGEPRLFAIPEHTAIYALRWARRIAAVAFFGYALAEMGLLFGLYRIAHDALLKLVVLTIHIFIIVIVLQNRAAIAALIRAPALASGQPATGMAALIRNRVAGLWHLVAIFYLLALWTVWALDVPDGFSQLLRLVLASAAIITAARLAANFVLHRLQRWTMLPDELAARYPGLETRITTYHPIARHLLQTAIWTAAVVALLEIWGISAFAWFTAGKLGNRLLGALGAIGFTILLALLVWESINTAIQRHLARLAREAQLTRSARLRTLLPMLRTVLLVTICLVTGLMVLSEIGINIAPLLAGAGVIGVALAFGSQKLVQDVITGLFLLLENAMQVGDAVTLGGLSGSVEALSVRTIRLRALDGSIHIIPFSAVTTVTNMTRDFGFAVIEVPIGLNEEPDRIMEILREIAREMRTEAKWADAIRDDVEIFGVDKFVDNAWVLQGRIKTTPGQRWAVRRELNRRIKHRFDELAIDSPVTSFQALNRLPPNTIVAPPPNRA